MVYGILGIRKKPFYKKKQHLIAVSTGPFGRVPTTRSLGDNNDHHGEFIMYPSLGMILQEVFFWGEIWLYKCWEIYLRPSSTCFSKISRAISYPPISHGQILPNLWNLPGEGEPRRVHTPKQKKNELLEPSQALAPWDLLYGFFLFVQLPSLKLTTSLHLKMVGWNTSLILGNPIFRGYVSFRECNKQQRKSS